jgi:hypothetical protein
VPPTPLHQQVHPELSSLVRPGPCPRINLPSPPLGIVSATLPTASSGVDGCRTPAVPTIPTIPTYPTYPTHWTHWTHWPRAAALDHRVQQRASLQLQPTRHTLRCRPPTASPAPSPTHTTRRASTPKTTTVPQFAFARTPTRIADPNMDMAPPCHSYCRGKGDLRHPQPRQHPLPQPRPSHGVGRGGSASGGNLGVHRGKEHS